MAYKTLENKRTSDDYKFTIDTKDDEMLVALKATIKKYNDFEKSQVEAGLETNPKYLRVCVKPRGPRARWAYHTMTEDATHFDVYVWTKYEPYSAFA